MGLSAGAYLSGVAELAAIAASLLYGAVRLRARLLPDWGGAPARLAEIVLAIAGLIWVSQLLGLLGIFKELPLVVASVGLGVGVGLWAKSAATPSPRRPEPDPVERLQIAATVIVVGVLFTQWALPTIDSLHGGMYGFDSHWYHMPFAVGFAQTGEIWPLNFTAPFFLNWFYPANAELLHSTAIVAFGRDLLSPMINLGWLAIALVSAWCIGRPWRVPGWSLLGVAIVLGATLFADQPGDSRNDTAALALILASGAILANAEIRGSRSLAVRAGPALVIAGIAAGLAVGTRLTALAPVAAITVGVIAVAAKETRVRVAITWIGAVLAASGLWFLRNFIESGNPLPWIDNIGPLSLPGPDQELGGREPFSVLHYTTDTEIWSEWFFPGLETALGLLWPAVLAASAAGAILALARGRGIPRVLGATAIVGGLAYLVTPVTASGPEGFPVGFASNLRFIAVPLALGLALLPVSLSLAQGRLPRRWWAWTGVGVIAILFISVVVESNWSTVYLRAGIAVGVGAAAIAAVSIAGYGGRLRLKSHRLVGIAVALIAVAIAIPVGYSVQRFYLDERYADPGEVLHENPGLPAAFKWAREVSDARIGITIQRQLPFYGTDLSNHVQFVGVHGSNGAFVRAATCEEWREAVDGGDYDYVVTAVDRAAQGSNFHSREEIWTRGAPNAQPIVRSGPATVWKLNGPLDPSACPHGH